MKPGEILGMVEETAGTRMYETKRVAALKTIEKKQKKLDELNSVLSEEITPTLVRLRGEKQHYLKWSKNNTEIERLERFVTAHEFYKGQQILASTEEEASEMEAELNEAETAVSRLMEDLNGKEEEIEELSTLLSGELEQDYKEAKIEEEKLSKDLVQVTAAWKNHKDVASSSKDDLSSAQTSVNELKSALASKEREMSESECDIKGAKTNAERAENELSRLQEEYQNMCAGISSANSDEGMTLPDQISKAHNDANNAEAHSKQATMKIAHLSKSIKVSLSTFFLSVDSFFTVALIS